MTATIPAPPDQGRPFDIVFLDRDGTINARVPRYVTSGSEQKLEELYGKSLTQVRADLQEEFRAQMMGDQLQQRRLGQIRITPSEVRTWFAQFPTDSLPTLPEMVRVSHVVRFPKLTDAARQEAFDILTVIRDSIVTGGASFEEMARQFTDDPGSATTGGHY